jgi:hypothetical protein
MLLPDFQYFLLRRKLNKRIEFRMLKVTKVYEVGSQRRKRGECEMKRVRDKNQDGSNRASKNQDPT